MAVAVTTDILRELAAFEPQNGCALSLYLDFDPSVDADDAGRRDEVQRDALRGARSSPTGTRRDATAELAAARRRGADPRRGGTTIRPRRRARRRALRLLGGRAVAGAAARDGRRRLGARRAVAPPRAARGPLGRGDGALVASSRVNGASVYRLDGGRLVEIVDESEERAGPARPGRLVAGALPAAHRAPRRRASEERRRRGRQARPERRRADDRRRRPRRRCAASSRRSSRRRRAPRSSAGRSVESHAAPTAILLGGVVRCSTRRMRDATRRSSSAGRRSTAAAGVRRRAGSRRSTRRRTRVSRCCCSGTAPPRAAWRCPECGRASADGGKCPLDGTKLEERADAADLAIHQTLANGGTVVRVGAGALADADGIGAVLRFCCLDEPGSVFEPGSRVRTAARSEKLVNQVRRSRTWFSY